MVIDQRNAGTSVTVTTAQSYGVDRFFGQGSITSKFTAQQSTTAPAGFINSWLLTSSAATTLGASDYYYFGQNIEGLNCTDLGWGTANAKTVTLSFQVYSSLTGTFSGAILNSADNRSYAFTYSIPTANTWTTISVTIAGDTSGTWLTTNGVGIKLRFALGAGSSFLQTAGSWGTGNVVGATGTTQWISTSGATFYITGVQLEAGTTASPFEYRQYGTEWALCQRYYQQITYAGSTINYLSGTAYDTFSIYDTTVYTLPVTMRSAPTFSTAGTFLLADGLGNNPAITTLTIGSMSMANSFKVVVVSTGLTTGRTYYLISTASSALKISAEL
jgi:hypothetical protein